MHQMVHGVFDSFLSFNSYHHSVANNENPRVRIVSSGAESVLEW